jgi:hypothetical protein
MSLIFPQQVTLFQVGDLVNGGSFNNFLDALDGSYCTFEGGDSKDPNIDGQYPDTCLVASTVLKIAVCADDQRHFHQLQFQRS